MADDLKRWPIEGLYTRDIRRHRAASPANHTKEPAPFNEPPLRSCRSQSGHTRGIASPTPAGSPHLGLPEAFIRSSRNSPMPSSKGMQRSGPQVDVPSGSQLRQFDGTYDWVRKANSQQDRAARQAVSQQTLAACNDSGYVLDGKPVSFTRLHDMLAETRIIRASVGYDILRRRVAALGNRSAEIFVHQPGLLMDVAVDRTRAKRKVVAVNAASAYHVGGGFLHGGRHALEESFCMQSTLFKALVAAKNQAEKQRIACPAYARPPCAQGGMPWQCHIPEDGAIVSPHVEVFRGGTNEGYPFWPEPVELCAIVSVAMPNCNPSMRDAPVDQPPDKATYQALLTSKFVAVLASATSVGASVLVIPDAGCGVYKNDAEVVGLALGRALLDNGCLGIFEEIHLVGSEKFAAAVKAAADPKNLQLPSKLR